MRMNLIVFVLATLPATSIAQQGRVIDCFCTDKTGGRVEMGQQLCLSVGGRTFMARCEMSQNVPMWRETGDACVIG